MKFFATTNLTQQAVEPVKPWEFQLPAPISEAIRKSKQDRADWAMNIATRHQFYTAIEGINPNQRVSKDNPPFKIHGIVADYDMPLDQKRVDDFVAGVKLKPAWVETSLGGNRRFVWPLTQPLLVTDMQFCTAFFDGLQDHLMLKLLPGLDEPAFTNSTRLYANGAVWQKTGAGPINLQGYYVEAARKFRFQGGDASKIPLDVVEARLRELYPNFSWPGEFAVGSQGPSFWVPGSTSPNSAIIKEEGIFTFSAHATKTFYSWADICGVEWCKQFKQDCLGKATENRFFDTKKFHCLDEDGNFTPMDLTELSRELRVTYKISPKIDKTGSSPLDATIQHICRHGRVQAAVPIIFQPKGLVLIDGKKFLNTYDGKPLTPATGTQHFGSHGNFPYASLILGHLFDPIEFQMIHWFGWLQYLIECAMENKGRPGQNTTMAGAAGIGKTLIGRFMVAPMVGGFVDASAYLLDPNTTFTSHLLEKPIWCVDDETPSSSFEAIRKFQTMMKKHAANQQHLYNKKYGDARMIDWAGRILVTTNLDPWSIRAIPVTNEGDRDKFNIYRCAPDRTIEFLSWDESVRTLKAELPYLMRYALDLKESIFLEAGLKRDSRYRWQSHQDETLVDKTAQSGSTAVFKEILVSTMTKFFKANPEEKIWRGLLIDLYALISSTNAANEALLRGLNPENMNARMEMILRESAIKCKTETGNSHKFRYFIFKREDFQ